MLQANLTSGRRYPHDGLWTFGRANIDYTGQTYQGQFPQNGLEWNATRLVSPGLFYVLGSNVSHQAGQGMSPALSLLALHMCALSAWNTQHTGKRLLPGTQKHIWHTTSWELYGVRHPLKPPHLKPDKLTAFEIHIIFQCVLNDATGILSS